MADDPYQVLGVERSDDLAHIRRAYLAQLRDHHPDVRPGDADAERRTRELNRAWEQVRARRAAPGGDVAPPPRPRRSTPAYSADQRAFRTAFTTASLRLALILFAFGLLLLLLALGR